MVWAATALQEKWVSARLREASPIDLRSPSSARTALIRSAIFFWNSSGLRGSKFVFDSLSKGTRKPVPPSTMISGMPPTRLATTGVPQAMASRLMMPKGS